VRLRFALFPLSPAPQESSHFANIRPRIDATDNQALVLEALALRTLRLRRCAEVSRDSAAITEARAVASSVPSSARFGLQRGHRNARCAA